jgi:hypothetical protein
LERETDTFRHRERDLKSSIERQKLRACIHIYTMNREERERRTERKRERETDRQTDRQRETETERKTKRREWERK